MQPPSNPGRSERAPSPANRRRDACRPVLDPAFEAPYRGLEELVLGYLGQPAGPAPAHLTTIGEGQ